MKDLQGLDKNPGEVERNAPEDLVQMTSMDMQFILNGMLFCNQFFGSAKVSLYKERVNLTQIYIFAEMSLVLVDKEYASSQPIEIASFKIKCLEVDMIQQTYNMKVNVRLKSVDMNQYIPKPINVITTPSSEKQNQYLINITYSQVSFFFII